MNDLLRELAPITSEAWKEIDGEAKNALEVSLAARKIVDFTGPLGWTASSVGLGRVDGIVQENSGGVEAVLRRVQPLVELRVSFELDRGELEAIARGAKDADLDPVRDAARAIARQEDRAVFHGFQEAGIEGMCEVADAAALKITEDYESYPASVSEALAMLKTAGVAGPYAIALGPKCYQGLTRTTGPGGYPVLQHVQKLLDHPVIWAPALDGAVVVSLRGGDFELVVGRDLSIGYQAHDQKKVELYIQESLTFRTLAPEAAVPLVYQEKKARPKK